MIDVSNMSRHPTDIYCNSRPPAVRKQLAGVVNHNGAMLNGHVAPPRDNRPPLGSRRTDNVVCSGNRQNGFNYSGHRARPQVTSRHVTSNDERLRPAPDSRQARPETSSISYTAQSAGYDVSRVAALDRTRRSGDGTEINNRSGSGSRREYAQHNSSGGDAGFGRESSVVIRRDGEWRNADANHARQKLYPMSTGEHEIYDSEPFAKRIFSS